MASQLVCDNCGARVRSNKVVGWWRLDNNDRLDIRTFDGSEGPWDYCTLSCVYEGTAKMISSKSQERRGCFE